MATFFGVRRRYITPVKQATFVIDIDQTIRSAITSEMKMEIHADEGLAAVAALNNR